MEKTNEKKLEIRKDFPITKDRLYESWIQPEDLSQWWTPLGSHLSEFNNEVKEKGTFRYVFTQAENKTSFVIHGKYLEVKKYEKLIYTWNWEMTPKTLEEENFTLAITFESLKKGSRLTVTQTGFTHDASLTAHAEGWKKGLNDLYEYLIHSHVKDPSGYNEISEQQKIGGYS